jgi:hypothetical protein
VHDVPHGDHDATEAEEGLPLGGKEDCTCVLRVVLIVSKKNKISGRLRRCVLEGAKSAPKLRWLEKVRASCRRGALLELIVMLDR